MKSPNFLRRSILIMALVSPFVAQAEPRPLLTIHAENGELQLSEAEFAALPQNQLTTHTPWTEGAHVFEGVLLRDVLAAKGFNREALQGKTLELRALNDYAVDVDAADAFTWDTLLARKMDGDELLRTDKGPIWLVYPRDSDPELQDRRYDHRWAWQLATIILK